MKFLESMYSNLESDQSMGRLEMKRYDEVVGDFRGAVYGLRRLVLGGSELQRKQVRAL